MPKTTVMMFISQSPPISVWLSLKSIPGELNQVLQMSYGLFHLCYLLYWSENKYMFVILQNKPWNLSKCLYFM